MPYYKGIFYADDSNIMSNTIISLDEATSTANVLTNISENIATPVSSQAERDALFPSPVQGNAVWRTDLGIEQRWFDAYNSSTNPSGRGPAGWYAITTSLVPISPPGVEWNSALSNPITLNFNQIKFDSVSGLWISRIFNNTFKCYKVIFETTLSASNALYLRFSTNGVSNSTASAYVQSAYYGGRGTTGGVGGFGLNTANAIDFWMGGTTMFGEITFSEMTTGKYPRATFDIANITGGGTPLCYMSSRSGFFDSTTTYFDGFVLYPAAGTMSGTMRVYGYN